MMQTQCTTPLLSDSGATQRLELSKCSHTLRHGVKVGAIVRPLEPNQLEELEHQLVVVLERKLVQELVLELEPELMIQLESKQPGIRKKHNLKSCRMSCRLKLCRMSCNLKL